MAQGKTRPVETELLDEPHIAGRRISVRQIHALIEEQEVDPETVADRFDLDLASVYHALAYFYDHPGEMREFTSERANIFEEFADSVDRPASVDPEKQK